MMQMARRRFLASMGASLFLPSLSRAQSLAPPKRLVVFFTQHGTVYDRWRIGGDFDGDLDLTTLSESEFSPILQPLHVHREKLLVVDGVAMLSAELDEPGSEHLIGTRHALTCERLVDGAAGGPSIDQVMARELRLAGRIDSLELAVGGAENGGAIWRAAGQSIPPDASPQSVFARVFPAPGTTPVTNTDRVRAAQPSVLDLVARQYDALLPRLSTADRQKLALHRDLVRDVERRVRDLSSVECARPGEPALDASYAAQSDAMFQLAAAALSCDLTRVVSFQMATLDGAMIGAPNVDVHAELAHLQNVDDDAHDKMTAYGVTHAQQFAQLVALLDSIPEGNGTLLDSCAVVWCSELADGTHGFRPWPLVVAGGLTKRGTYVRTISAAPHNRFWIALAHALGASIASFGPTELVTPEGLRIDCTGPLEGITT